jgi:hypothetical protein
VKPVALVAAAIALGLALVAADARAEGNWSTGQCFQPQPTPPAWHKQPWGTPELRLSAAPELGHLSGEGIGYAGGTLAVGLESLFSVSAPLGPRLFLGSVFGGELRLHAFRSIEGAPRSSLVAAGLAFTAYVVQDRDTPFARLVRFPSLFAVITPEAGVALRQPQPTSFYLRWSAPVALLVHPNVALELVPAVSLLYSTPTGRVEELWQIGLAVSWRHLGKLPRICLL